MIDAGWFDARRPPPPAALAARLAAAAGTQPTPTVMAAAALDRLGAAIALCPHRDAALELLTADGLLTYTFEAAAAHGLEEVTALLDRLTPAHFATLLTAGRPPAAG